MKKSVVSGQWSVAFALFACFAVSLLLSGCASMLNVEHRNALRQVQAFRLQATPGGAALSINILDIGTGVFEQWWTAMKEAPVTTTSALVADGLAVYGAIELSKRSGGGSSSAAAATDPATGGTSTSSSSSDRAGSNDGATYYTSGGNVNIIQNGGTVTTSTKTSARMK
jgi:hypothetical protein